MARFEKRTLALLMGAVAFAPVGLAAELSYEVWHGHSRPPHIRKAGNTGTLVINDAGVAFNEHYPDGEKPDNPHAWRWSYEDIQQLTIAPNKLKVLTYRDNRWKLGADPEYEFTMPAGRTFEDAYAALKGALDQRLVAALPDRNIDVLWELPVKHARRFGGDHGVLQFAENGVAFKANEEKGQSRTWRWQDIESISSSGPFQLTITTFERARMHYGDRKDFNFDLKRRLEEARYNELWQRVNQANGLTILRSYGAGDGRQTSD